MVATIRYRLQRLRIMFSPASDRRADAAVRVVFGTFGDRSRSNTSARSWDQAPRKANRWPCCCRLARARRRWPHVDGPLTLPAKRCEGVQAYPRGEQIG